MNVLRQSSSKSLSHSKLNLVETIKRTLDLPAEGESSDEELSSSDEELNLPYRVFIR